MGGSDSSAIVSKVWNYPPPLSELWRTGAHVLKNAGVGYGDYVEVRAARALITYLLFLKLAPSSLRYAVTGDEMTELGFDPPSLRYGRAGNPIPDEFKWSELSSKSGDPPSLKLRRAGELEWSGATWTTRKGCPEGERGGAHQIHYRHPFRKSPGLGAHLPCLCN